MVTAHEHFWKYTIVIIAKNMTTIGACAQISGNWMEFVQCKNFA